MRKPSPPNEAAYQRALQRVRKSLSEPGDLSWQDRLPEAPEIPAGPEDVSVLMIPKVEEDDETGA